MADPDKPREDAPPSEHPAAEAVGSSPVEPVTRTFEGRFSVVGGVRRTVARGTLVNAGFLVTVSLLASSRASWLRASSAPRTTGCGESWRCR